MKNSLLSQHALGHLVIIDMQERLASAMPHDAFKNVTKNCGILLQAAALLEVPTLYTEQYPKGLGKTLPDLMSWLTTRPCVEKVSFSCCDEPTFCRLLTSDRPQVVLAGLEAHICILQTALALQAMGRIVFVAEDAVLSRSEVNKENALNRLRQAGVIISNTESIVFEWLGKAEGEAFKELSRLVR